MVSKVLKSSLPPKKKRKTAEVDSQVKVLEETIGSAIRNSTSLNALADLLALASSTSDAKVTHAAIYALYRSTVLLCQAGSFGSNKHTTPQADVVRKWLDSRLAEFGTLLAGLLKDEERDLRIAALNISLSLLATLSPAVSVPGTPRVHLPHLRKLVRGLLICPASPRPQSDPKHGQGPGQVELDVCEKFVEDHLSVYDDLRWLFLREATELLKATSTPTAAHENLLSFLELLMTMPTEASEINSFWIKEFSQPPPKPGYKNSKKAEASSSDDEKPPVAGEEDWRAFFDDEDKDDKNSSASSSDKRRKVSSMSLLASLHSLQSHRVQFSNCWAALVPHLGTSSSLSSRALSILHRGVLPHLTRPSRLMDWIATCVDFGGSVGLLALNGLFTLIKDYNLDYPDFYTRLYAFLDRNVLHVKHRARFFRLADIFLSSTHLPVQLLASFVKRLSRLSLFASPPAIVMIIPFTYNILKRHPALMTLIHQERIDGFQDPFNPKEPNPLLTNAISSSLWELASHQDHYLETVSTLARIFTTPFTQTPYLMEEFLDHTYSTMFEAESKRTFKKDPAMTIEFKKEDLFPPSGNEDEVLVTTDIVAELWRFG